MLRPASRPHAMVFPNDVLFAFPAEVMSGYKFRANQALTSKQFWRALICYAELLPSLAAELEAAA